MLLSAADLRKLTHVLVLLSTRKLRLLLKHRRSSIALLSFFVFDFLAVPDKLVVRVFKYEIIYVGSVRTIQLVSFLYYEFCILFGLLAFSCFESLKARNVCPVVRRCKLVCVVLCVLRLLKTFAAL